MCVDNKCYVVQFQNFLCHGGTHKREGGGVGQVKLYPLEMCVSGGGGGGGVEGLKE